MVTSNCILFKQFSNGKTTILNAVIKFHNISFGKKKNMNLRASLAKVIKRL